MERFPENKLGGGTTNHYLMNYTDLDHVAFKDSINDGG
jgi:hypothetical protein